MVVGRGIFGIGAEWTYVAVPLIVLKWFRGKEITQALGIAQCFPYLVSYVTGHIIPSFYEKFGFTQTFGLGALFCLVSVMSSLKVSFQSRKAMKNEIFEDGSFKLRDILSFKAGVYVLLFDCMLNFGAISTFISIGSKQM